MIDKRPRKKILIVDDGRTDIDVLKDTLKDDYKLGIALNGSQALEAARSGTPPDLIILDIMMPGMDGFEVCRRMKIDALTREIPIIFLTAKIEPADEIRGLAAGAVDYINKPISPPVVRARVKAHLALRAAQQVLSQQNKALQEAEQLRMDVERIARHDMKSPISGILGFAQLMRSDPDIPLADRGRYLDIIIDVCYRLQEMVNQSLHLFKMEQGNYPLNAKTFDLLPLLNRITDNLDMKSRRKKITLCILLNGHPVGEEERFTVHGEEPLCYTLFANLIKNALEASPANQTLSIVLRDDKMAIVVIHNQGAVPADIRDRFFEKYVTRGKETGTGLGTYSALLMTETQGGSIHMDSSEAAGTTVTVRLPKKGGQMGPDLGKKSGSKKIAQEGRKPHE